MDNFYTINPKSDLSKISLTNSQSTELNNLQSIKSTTHFIQPLHISHQTTGLMTKATLMAINKTPRQRTKHDIEILEHLLNNCDNLRHLPTNVRSYAARSLLFLTYHPNTILTRQNLPSFLVYIIVYGHCKLLLETQQTTIFGHQLNIGDVYGDDHRLNGLITNESTHCNLIVFFLRDIKAYENYLSDMMKQLLFEQLRIQSTFNSIQWKDDILNYFLKWSKYKQYSIDEIIYGNEEYEHNNLYFILYGQVSFVRHGQGKGDVIVTTKSGGIGSCSVGFYGRVEQAGQFQEVAVWIEEDAVALFGLNVSKAPALLPGSGDTLGGSAADSSYE
ncbi:unnamed protein product [Adineta steineri]|uniref:Cyclic nucleotide-binding domain-containing protein n=1 Tax=Adineta steineri TaxID=433720 RepID=A0A814VEB9_9BILA|nr:unnamed protein product [Adineta steineri]